MGPAPHGAGGLKFNAVKSQLVTLKSRPARGGWIEILTALNLILDQCSPAPHGAGGLKLRLKLTR